MNVREFVAHWTSRSHDQPRPGTLLELVAALEVHRHLHERESERGVESDQLLDHAHQAPRLERVPPEQGGGWRLAGVENKTPRDLDLGALGRG